MMRITVLARTTSLFLLLILSACGFHLRGSGSDKFVVEKINVTSSNAYSEMQRTLEDALRQAGARPVTADKAKYSVQLVSERNTRRAAATSTDVRVSQYELRLEVQFELVDSKAKAVIPTSSVAAERLYRFDSSSLVGNSEEEDLLNQEMRRDVANQIVRRVDASIRAGSVSGK